MGFIWKNKFKCIKDYYINWDKKIYKYGVKKKCETKLYKQVKYQNYYNVKKQSVYET